ncbi:MAG: hypothetical protein Q7W02_20080 [Candidatus Rokubacteria bacterium]|nr:hypothetical protein [Candidatus Rokubacteria bacterium]
MTPARLAYLVYFAAIPAISTKDFGAASLASTVARAEVVFAITAAICDDPERLRAIHPAPASFDPGRAHLEPGGPFHEGAARYFAARGGPEVRS